MVEWFDDVILLWSRHYCSVIAAFCIAIRFMVYQMPLPWSYCHDTIVFGALLTMLCCQCHENICRVNNCCVVVLLIGFCSCHIADSPADSPVDCWFVWWFVCCCSDWWFVWWFVCCCWSGCVDSYVDLYACCWFVFWFVHLSAVASTVVDNSLTVDLLADDYLPVVDSYCMLMIRWLLIICQLMW